MIAGLFDPLTAAAAKRFETLRGDRSVLAIVLHNSDALLTADARASLVAALREVRAVVLASDACWRSVIPESPYIRIIEDPEGELRRTAEFAAFVLSRQAARND